MHDGSSRSHCPIHGSFVAFLVFGGTSPNLDHHHEINRRGTLTGNKQDKTALLQSPSWWQLIGPSGDVVQGMSHTLLICFHLRISQTQTPMSKAESPGRTFFRRSEMLVLMRMSQLGNLAINTKHSYQSKGILPTRQPLW
jgi:hypothetical protein